MLCQRLVCLTILLFCLKRWLNDSFTNSELSLKDYIIYRCDRNRSTSSCLGGGGGGCSSQYAPLISHHSVLIDPPINNIEQLFVKIRIGHLSVIVCAVYLPPQSVPAIYDAHCQSVVEIRQRFPNYDIIVVGDYNLPNSSFLNDIYGTLCHSPTHYGSEGPVPDIICEYFNLLNLQQLNHIHNLSDRMLDLCFSSNKNFFIYRSVETFLPLDPHHPVLILSFPPQCSNPPPPSRLSIPDFFECKLCRH